MRRALSLAATILISLSSAAQESQAQEDPAKASAKLDDIRVQVVAAEASLASLQKEFNELVAQRTQVTESLRRLKRDDQLLEEKLLQVEEERRRLAEDVSAAEVKVAAERERNAKRIRALYTEVALACPLMAIGASGQGQLERVAVYSRSVRESDQRRFEGLRRAAQELIAARESLEASIRQAQGLREEITIMRQDAERKQKELQKIAKELQARKESAQRSLALLKREAQELEAVIAAIAMGSEREEKEDEEDRGEDTGSQEDEAAEQQRQGAPELDPRGLFSARGSLSAPVKGKVVQHFGKVKLASFKDVLFSKGVEFSTPENDEVHAVLAGLVAFSGTLPGYDTVVILDHGARSYSLYGRLGTSVVKKGETVGRDHVIGTTSAADKRGRNFYFEVRRGGTPVDPESILPRISR